MGAESRRAFHTRLEEDLLFFGRHMLKIKTKEGYLEPFLVNKAQIYLHDRAERQKKKLGRIRLIIVKGRQQGCSTYIGGRFYHTATRKKNKSVFILSHQADTTKKLFRMVERYHDNIPTSAKPHADTANRKEMEFKKINSDYCVGTAGSDDVGRGGTVQLFHGSEVAFWEKVENVQTGVLQSVADMDNTEIFLESTANGMGNAFFVMTMEATKGESDYEVVFIPWYWQEEYQREIPSNGKMEITEEEEEFREFIRSQGEIFGFELTNQQLYWRRSKIAELKSDWMFKQEYPSYLMEAFQTTGDTYIKAQSIMEARKSQVTDPEAPLIMGVDPAGKGKDRVIFSYRKGRQFLPHEEFNFGPEDEQVEMQIAGLIARRINKEEPAKVFVDCTGSWGIVDRLKELGYGQIVQGIGFKTKATEDDVYANKRAEIWGNLKDFIHKEDGEVSIPDTDEIQTDLSSMPREIVNSSGKTQMVAKEKIKKDLGMSPDIGDAMALTFSFPVRRDSSKYGQRNKFKRKVANESSLSTLNRIRRYNKDYGSSVKRR